MGLFNYVKDLPEVLTPCCGEPLGPPGQVQTSAGGIQWPEADVPFEEVTEFIGSCPSCGKLHEYIRPPDSDPVLDSFVHY